MKRLFPLILALLLFMLSVGVYAMNAEPEVGEVLYHQDFNDVTDIVNSGIRIGTASSVNSMVGCPAESLEIHTYDSGRVYVILPDIEKGEDGSYTIEFTFRFTDIHKTNGFIAPILTCRGSEPSNITSLVIRADGTIDDFETPDEALQSAISGGETISVRIPVQSWAIHKIILSAGDIEYTLERESVLKISSGSIGFTVRNANASIDEVYLVFGTDYEEKIGYYADQSYATDEAPAVSETNGESAELSPATADGLMIMLSAAAVCGVSCVILKRKCRH